MEKITAMSNPPYDATVAVILLMLVTLASTASVWVFGSDDYVRTPSMEKTKRDSDARMQLLLQLMDEREKAQLKARLLNDLESNADGEISLEMLLGKR
ncbi:MAG: hypothetical protein K8I82_03700 [Anaerolineae bacterium]|nr:hypothetical protein [Anaerolineae bacterium]